MKRQIDEHEIVYDCLDNDNLSSCTQVRSGTGLNSLHGSWASVRMNLSKGLPMLYKLMTDLEEERGDFILDPVYIAAIDAVKSRITAIEDITSIPSPPATEDEVDALRQAALEYRKLLDALYVTNQKIALYLRNSQ